MPSIYDLKPKFQQLLGGLVARLAKAGITANQVTLSAMAASVLYGVCLYVYPQSAALWLGLPIFLFIRMALNAIDGMLARQYKQKSALGGLLNEIGDVISDTALTIPFALLAGAHSALVMLVILLAILTEFIGVCAVNIGASRRYDGPMGKSDRAFIFGALALAHGLGMLPANYLNGILALVAVSLVITAFNRASKALQEVQA